MLIKRLAAAFSGLCLGLLTCSVQASTLLDKAIEAHEATPPKTVSVDIIANRTAGTPRSDYAVAIRLRHAPGWHTYWRYAGDTGYPISVQWTLPRNWQATSQGWPLPQRKTIGNLTNFTYTGEILLPFKLDIPWGTPYGTSGRIKAKVEWLACKDVCIPGEATVQYTVPVRVASEPSKQAAPFDKIRRSIPELVTTKNITATMEQDRLRVDFQPLAGRIEKNIAFIPDHEGIIDLKKIPQIETSEGTTKLYLTADQTLIKNGGRLDGIFVADGGPLETGWAIRTSLPIGSGPVSFPQPDTKLPPPDKLTTHQRTINDTTMVSLTGSMAILFAFLGGLILNLMPCVFPVLSLKILQLVDSSRRRGSLASHGLAFTAGIMLSMLILAGALISLRRLGVAVGWGFQLQTPWVVSVLGLLFFAISLNLLGLFEFTAASHLADSRAVRALPTTGPAGSFSTGVLAVVVASPCTAPFMGAALGYAVMQSSLEAILVFLALGLGMALPWLILTIVPFWTRWLPKPGRWMAIFKCLMAIPMIGATLWLFWVLSRQVNIYGLITEIFATGSTAAFLWAIGREQYGRGATKPVKWLCGAITLACVGLLMAGMFDAKSDDAKHITEHWQPWSEKAVTEAVEAGHPVIIDFTAAWCVTCQYNKAAALRTQAAQSELSRYGYRQFIADWTNRDAEISKTLNAYGRTGVPLYLLYDRNGNVTILPEILTESSFIEALRHNANNPSD